MRLLALGVLIVLATGPSLLRADDPLPSDAQKIVDLHAEAEESIRLSAESKLQKRRAAAIAALWDLQESYTKAGKLNEAVAIRATIDELKSQTTTVAPTQPVVLPAPNHLYDYRNLLNRPLYFQLTGQPGGTVWGTDVYTGDSYLPAAAIHAGAVELGETAVVKVTMLPPQPAYEGSLRNNITTQPYGSYSFSYKVERTRIPVSLRLTPPSTSAGYPPMFDQIRSGLIRIEPGMPGAAPGIPGSLAR